MIFFIVFITALYYFLLKLYAEIVIYNPTVGETKEKVNMVKIINYSKMDKLVIKPKQVITFTEADNCSNIQEEFQMSGKGHF